MAMTAAAIGVFAAAAKSATNPTAARKGGGSPSHGARAAPLAAPMKKIGVRMPPLPPVSSVMTVARIFNANTLNATGMLAVSSALIRSVPSPA